MATATKPVWCDKCGIPKSYHPSPEEWRSMCERVDVSALVSPCAVAEVRFEARDHAG